MVKSAVILAGGLGSRLKEKTKLKPKGFLEINQRSLIQRSVETLFKLGIEKIYIGTGYLSEVYDEFALKYNGKIITIKSEKYKTTSSMFTFYNMRNYINEDFILLESDLLYEDKAIQILLNENKEDIILSSGKTYSNDEVYIEVDSDKNLLNMSKSSNDLNSIYSELVGISKISLERYKLMCNLFENIIEEKPKIDYEYVMVESSKIKPFYVKKIDDLIWCEIDDASHLKRALEKILPKIGD